MRARAPLYWPPISIDHLCKQNRLISNRLSKTSLSVPNLLVLVIRKKDPYLEEIAVIGPPVPPHITTFTYLSFFSTGLD